MQRGRIEVHSVVNGSVEPIAELATSCRDEESEVSPSTSSAVGKSYHSRATGEGNSDDLDRDDSDYIQPRNLQSRSPRLPVLVRTKSRHSIRSGSAVSAEARDLTTKHLQKPRIANTKTSTRSEDRVSMKAETADTVAESPSRSYASPTLPPVEATSENSSVCNQNTASNLPRTATLLSVAQKALTIRRKSRTVKNPSFTRPFVFSYFVRLKRS